jgi:hypothetical protein
MPYITETEHAKFVRLKFYVSEIKPHVSAWIDLLETHVRSLPEDAQETPEAPGLSDKSYAEHELLAMKRDLGSLVS